MPTFERLHSSHSIMCGRHCVTAPCTIAVAGVLSVPAFAQTDTAARVLAFERSAVGIVREYVPSGPAPADAVEVPANLHATSAYRRIVESMLERSPSFREQCRRIANARMLTVRLQSAPHPLQGARARSRIVRRENRLEATIEIARFEDAVELVAHEIEHVIEQLDEIDLAARAEISRSGVRLWDPDDGMFETTRAIRIGLRVAEEVRRGGG